MCSLQDSLEGACLTGFLCRPWTSGCTDCCHWVTRTLWSCSCCWSQCHDQTIFWTGSKDLSHVFVYGSQSLGAVDAKNQGPAGGVDHKKSDSKTNVVLQPYTIPISIVDTIIGTHSASWARGWSFNYSCQHKGELCWSLRERPRHGWLREM